MSMTYWAIEGYGICIDDIAKYLNKEKASKYAKELCPDREFEEDILNDSAFYGDVYTNFSEFLCDLDETSTLTWEDDGQGTSYLLYEPTYPWTRRSNEPKTFDDMVAILVKTITKVYDISVNELMNLMDYISTYGGA